MDWRIIDCWAIGHSHSAWYRASAFVAIVLGLIVSCIGCTTETAYPSRPILLVCPWGQGGGTDSVSRMLAAHLEIELGTPVNVINATGGKGVTGHNRGLSAKPDGYTLTMTTLELNTMHWLGLTSLTVEDCVPLMSLNEDYAALLVRDDAAWQTLAELEAAIGGAETTLQASGTTTGGAWHLALAGWLIQSDLGADAVTWISSTGSAESLQELLSGGIDMVCCSLPEADSLIASGKVRALGVMSPKRANGYETIMTFAEQGTDWSLGGWRALSAPKDLPAEIEARLMTALRNITDGKTKVGDPASGTATFADFMKQQRYDHTIRTGEPLRQFLSDTDQKLGTLLQNDAMQAVRADRFSPHTFPRIIGVLMLGVVIAHLVQTRLSPVDGELSNNERATVETTKDQTNWLALAAVIVAMLVYWQFAETVGFVLLAVMILFVMTLAFRASWRSAISVSMVLPPLIYQLFAHTLRVPLPQGWLGW